MLTILDFVNAGGKCITAAGWEFQICYINKDIEYPICGYVISPSGVKSLYHWDVFGDPFDLPLTHGLNLVPVVPIITYHIIDIAQLSKFARVQDLVNSEIKRISNRGTLCSPSENA
jgi:hypothetical protein